MGKEDKGKPWEPWACAMKIRNMSLKIFAPLRKLVRWLLHGAAHSTDFNRHIGASGFTNTYLYYLSFAVFAITNSPLLFPNNLSLENKKKILDAYFGLVLMKSHVGLGPRRVKGLWRGHKISKTLQIRFNLL